MDQKSSSNGAQQQARKLTKEELWFVHEVQKLVGNIQDSLLPEGKKLAYLYMIAEGSFTLKMMEDISLELEVIGELKEAEYWRKKREILELEQQLAMAEQEVDDLTVQAAKEYQDNIETFLTYTANHIESAKTEEEQQAIESLRKDLL